MSTQTVHTDSEFAEAKDLKPFVCTVIADAKKRELSPWSTVSDFGADEDSTSCHYPLPNRHDSGHQPRVLELLAKEMALIVDPSASMVVRVLVPSDPSTATQIAATPRPAWQPQIKTASTHEEIVAMLRLFGLAPIADRLSYLRSLADDDPDEPTIKIESLRAMALFLMDERQLSDPHIGVTPDGLIQVEWRLPTRGILAMVFLTSGMIHFAAISGPTQAGIERLRVNGTLPKDGALAAVQPFSSQLEPR